MSFLNKKFTDWTKDVSALANPLLLLFVPFVVLGPSKYYCALLLALLANEIIGTLIKVFFHRKRPDGQVYTNLIEKIDAGSFPSLHSSRITLSYLFIINFTDYLSVKITLIIAVILVLVSRIVLKKHYWSDVIGGAIIGSTIAWVLILFQK